MRRRRFRRSAEPSRCCPCDLGCRVVGDEEKGHQIRGGKSWSGREDLNLRPQDPQSCALPGCATPRPNQIKCLALGILSPRGGMCRPYLQNRRITRLTAQWMGMNERRVRGRRREEEVTVELNESLTSGLQNDARTGAVRDGIVPDVETPGLIGQGIGADAAAFIHEQYVACHVEREAVVEDDPVAPART